MAKWYGPQDGDCSCCPQDDPTCVFFTDDFNRADIGDDWLLTGNLDSGQVKLTGTEGLTQNNGTTGQVDSIFDLAFSANDAECLVRPWPGRTYTLKMESSPNGTGQLAMLVYTNPNGDVERMRWSGVGAYGQIRVCVSASFVHVYGRADAGGALGPWVLLDADPVSGSVATFEVEANAGSDCIFIDNWVQRTPDGSELCPHCQTRDTVSGTCVGLDKICTKDIGFAIIKTNGWPVGGVPGNWNMRQTLQCGGVRYPVGGCITGSGSTTQFRDDHGLSSTDEIVYHWRNLSYGNQWPNGWFPEFCPGPPPYLTCGIYYWSDLMLLRDDFGAYYFLASQIFCRYSFSINGTVDCTRTLVFRGTTHFVNGNICNNPWWPETLPLISDTTTGGSPGNCTGIDASNVSYRVLELVETDP